VFQNLPSGFKALEKAARHIGPLAKGPDMLKAYAHANTFMEVAGDIVMAWMLLWRAMEAAKAPKKDIAYYTGQIYSAEHFIHTVIPVTIGKAVVIIDASDAAVRIPDEAFESY
jgi:hypothetical protein